MHCSIIDTIKRKIIKNATSYIEYADEVVIPITPKRSRNVAYGMATDKVTAINKEFEADKFGDVVFLNSSYKNGVGIKIIPSARLKAAQAVKAGTKTFEEFQRDLAYYNGDEALRNQEEGFQNQIDDSEITYTDENGEICAKIGLTDTVSGTNWKIVKDFKGEPKHSQGGVDITISDKGVTMRRGGKDIKAKHGLLIPTIMAGDGLLMDNKHNSNNPTAKNDNITNTSTWNRVKSELNPKNWNVTDYTDSGDFNTAFSSARTNGEKEFMWNNKRYSTTEKSYPGEDISKRDDLFTGNMLRSRIPIFKDLINTDGEFDKNTYAKLRTLYDGKEIEGKIRTSKYKPTKSKNKNTTYYSVTTEETTPFLINLVNHIEDNKENLTAGYLKLYKTLGKHNEERALRNVNSTKNVGPIRKTKDSNGNIIPNTYNIPRYFKTSNDYKIRGLSELGNYQVSLGKDKRGKYIAYYDLWDTSSPTEYLGGSKPFEVYDRVYYKDYGNGRKKRMYYSDKELSKLNINKRNFDTLALQRELSNRGYILPKSTKKDNTLDGIWGNETKQALLDYQNKNK